MPQYNPPLRDMQFVMHEVLKMTDEFKVMPQHAEVDVETINAVLEEAGKFAAEVAFPLNISGDTEGCQLDISTHEVTVPAGFKPAYQQYIAGGWAALSCDPAYGGQGLPFAFEPVPVRDAELRQSGVGHVPGPVTWRVRSAARAWH